MSEFQFIHMILLFSSTELETLVVDLVAIYGKIFQVAICSSKLHENFSPIVLNRPNRPNRNQIALKI